MYNYIKKHINTIMYINTALFVIFIVIQAFSAETRKIIVYLPLYIIIGFVGIIFFSKLMMWIKLNLSFIKFYMIFILIYLNISYPICMLLSIYPQFVDGRAIYMCFGGLLGIWRFFYKDPINSVDK